MVRVSCRRFTATSLAGVAALASALRGRRAVAAEFVFKWGTNVPENHPLNMHARKAAEAIKGDTEGRFDLQLFPNNQLGGDADMFSQLRVAALECFTLSGVAARSTLVPSASISGRWLCVPELAVRLDRP